jgi:DNA-binding beta-propeller fold protein YncE
LFSVQDTAPEGIFFKPDGLKMYIVGSGGDSVYEYDLGTTSTITLPAALENNPTQILRGGTRVTYEFITADAGVTVTLIGEEIV